jgi:hypothetical protein
LIDSLIWLSLMAWKIRAYGSARSISNLSFWAELGSSKSIFEPIWLSSAQPTIVGSTIPALHQTCKQHRIRIKVVALQSAKPTF